MNDMTARAFWVTKRCHGEIREEVLPQRGPDEVLVRTRYSAISRGTESLIYRGEVPRDEYARMRAPHQIGDFPGPVKYGYISVGEVEAGATALVGRQVFCLHPHQDRYIVPSAAVTLLPPGVPPERAVLSANLETAINGLWDAAPGIGDRIAVIGAGAVGCLVAWLAARLPGCNVELIDINPDRRVVAESLGARFAHPDDATRAADLVIHASGRPAGLATALELAGKEAAIIELSWFGESTATLALGGAFHSQRLVLRGSQVGTIPADRRARWDYRRRLELALSLLDDPILDALITGESAFEDLPATMHRLACGASVAGEANGPDGTRDTLCHRIVYD